MSELFICHRTADKTNALKLTQALRDAGHNVWIDTDEIAIGDSIVEKIDQGLSNSAYLILCYSSSGVNAPWTRREWMSTLARQLEGLPVVIMPVRLTGLNGPAIMADIRAADCLTDFDAGVRDLLRSIR